MKVCIVGASGKLGRYMVQHALNRGYEVTGVCRAQSAAKLYAMLRCRRRPGATANTCAQAGSASAARPAAAVASYSYGMQQRLAVAAAAAFSPRFTWSCLWAKRGLVRGA